MMEKEQEQCRGDSKVSTLAVFTHFGTSGISVAVATAFTHPLGLLRVRLQMQLVGQRGPLIGMREIFSQIMKKEGTKALYQGLIPALTRSILYGGLRLGLYEPSKYACDAAFGSSNILVKIASGAFAGVVATALTNPVEVLKVRQQMHAGDGLRKIIAEEGVEALWKGVGPAMARAAALTASQLATYDETKQLLASSSVVAGGVGTLMTAPADMVKTRLMLQRNSKAGVNYRNGFHCAYQVFVAEGARGVYKGGLMTFARLGPQTTITFVLYEKLRKLAGLQAI